MDDKKLVELIGFVPDEGIRRFLECHGGAIKAVIARMLDEPDAADALNETLRRIWISIGTYDAKKGSLRVWATVIAQRVARGIKIDIAKHQTFIKQFGDGIERLEDRSSGHQPQLGVLDDALSSIHWKQRYILEADMAAGGIAPATPLAIRLKVSIINIYVLRYRALRAVREYLINHPEEDYGKA